MDEMMKEGIAIVGLNGSGKSTLGHALARELNYYEIDVEDYYFPEQRESRRMTLDCKYVEKCNYMINIKPYVEPSTKKDVEKAIEKEILEHPKYVIIGVTMNWNAVILSTIKCIFWIKTDTDERKCRVKMREEKRWGSRVDIGGDMYEQMLSFINRVKNVTDGKVADNISRIGCEVIELDGTLPVQKNLEIIMKHI